MTKHINIDKLLAKHQLEEGELTYALKQALYDLMLGIIGSDLPLDQPGDDDMDNITLRGHLIFRKGANWLKEEQRQKLTNLFKGDKE